MSGGEGVMLVMGATPGWSEQLKQLIEFMDVSGVRVATPDDWRQQVGDRRLAAVFLGSDLGQHAIQRVIGDVGELDQNVDFVLVESAKDD